MDFKRLLLFVVLTYAILAGWQVLFPPPPRAAVETSTVDAVPGGPDAPLGTDAAAAPLLAPPDGAEPWEETVLLGRPGTRGHYSATFSSEGGTLAALRISDYHTSGRLSEDARADPSTWVPLVLPVDTGASIQRSLTLIAGPSARALFPYPLDRVHWEHELLREGDVVVGVRFRHQPAPGGITLEKTIRVLDGNYELEVSLALIGGEGAEAGGRAGFRFIPAVGVPLASEDNYYQEPQARAAGRSSSGSEIALSSKAREDRGKETSGSFSVGQTLAFVGVDNKYFAMLLHPIEGERGELGRNALTDSSWARLQDREYQALNPDAGPAIWRHVIAEQGLSLPLPKAGDRYDFHYRLYAGPKDRSILEEHDHGFEALVRKDLGFFDGIASFLVGVLGFLEGIVGNWGLAIILLTLLVRGALFPINRRSQTAMARHATKMKRVQPRLNDAKERHKDNPKKLREEQAKIMQEEGAFPPLGGCLPVFLQIPIFFGLFAALRVSFDLRQARFLWVDDLSMPDRLMRTGVNMTLPLVGDISWLNVLPPLMVVLWIVQQRVMPKPTEEQALRMHKMMMWMPIMFGVFLYNYAAGLSLYMITSSLFGILEYTVVRKIWPLDEREMPAKKGRFAKKWAEALERVQEQQRLQGPGRNPPRGGSNKKR